jgi:hypothetical protein
MNDMPVRPIAHLVAAAAFAIPIMLQATAAEASQKQYRALMARFFLQNHQAIPLHNNGNVRSGDVLKLPEEATYVPRQTCYDFGPVAYTTLKSEFIKTSFEIAGEAGGSAAVQKIVEIEAELGGKLQTETSILLDPLSQEQPPKGIVSLQTPKPNKDCDIIRSILSGSGKDLVLVTRVFHGKEIAQASFAISGNANISAAIKEARIKAILGGSPDVHVKVSSSSADLQLSKSPDQLSLAIQSAVIKPQQLARIYLQSQSNNKYQLEVLVEEYVTGSGPDVLKEIEWRLKTALEELGLYFKSLTSLYSSVFSGDGAIPLERASADIPPEYWRAFAVVAAAHEIVGEPPRQSPR